MVELPEAHGDDGEFGNLELNVHDVILQLKT
jgi:hypothetical protein